MATHMQERRKPKLVVFDLDYTLWPFWVDTLVDPPFQKRESGEVVDRRGRIVKHFPEVPKVLRRLQSEGYKVAIASRTDCIVEANVLISLFDWNKYILYKEIYPGCKTQHFTKFKEYSGILFEDMLFFDDEHRNILDLSKHGVTCYNIDDNIGMTEAVLEEGFKKFADNIRDKSSHNTHC